MYLTKIEKEEVNKMPLASFSGKIKVIDSPEAVAAAFNDINSHECVGIDTETKPSFVKGARNKISLVQIATLDNCYLFRLNKIGFPKEMTDFLSDEKIIKVGLSLHDDFNGLKRHRLFNPKNIVDIQKIARNWGILELGLQKIYAIVFGEKISKSQRLTNWEMDELTPHQQQYAAIDAWACLRLFNRLSGEKKITKKQLEHILQEEALKHMPTDNGNAN